MHITGRPVVTQRPIRPASHGWCQSSIPSATKALPRPAKECTCPSGRRPTTAHMKKPNVSCSSSTTAAWISWTSVIAARRAPSRLASASWRVRLRSRAAASSSWRGRQASAALGDAERDPAVALLGASRKERHGELVLAQDLAAAVGALAVQQRAVGLRDQVAGGHAGRPLGDPGGRARAAVAGQVAETEADPLERAGGDLARDGVVRLGGDQRELVAAVAGGEVVGPRGRAQRVADAAQHLVADQVAVLVVDLLEAVQVDQDERQRSAGRALGPLDLAGEAVVHRSVVEAAGERVGAGGFGQPGADGGVRERDGGELGERLQPFEVPAAQRDAAAVRDGEDAAQLPRPVHRHGHRGLDVLPGRARPGAADLDVALGHHGLVGEQHLAGQALARRQPVAEVLGREPGRRLERQRFAVVVRHPVDHGAVGPDQQRGLVADAGQERPQVGRLVERLGRAGERGVEIGGALVLERRRPVGEGGGRRRGERDAQLDGRVVADVGPWAGDEEDARRPVAGKRQHERAGLLRLRAGDDAQRAGRAAAGPHFVGRVGHEVRDRPGGHDGRGGHGEQRAGLGGERVGEFLLGDTGGEGEHA